MQTASVFFLVHIHTPKMDFYALRDTFENAQEEVFEHAQGDWSSQFPGVPRPSSKAEVIERYFQAVSDNVYAHIVDIEVDGNWIMEDANRSNWVLK